MNARVRAICTHETALGLALTGIAPIEAANGAEAAAALDALAGTAARGGVIFVEDRLYAALPSSTRREIQRAGLPILMPFPGPTPSDVAPEHELLEVLRRAVGYRMRLR